VSPTTYPANVSWSGTAGGLNVSFTGTVETPGNRMSGTITASAIGFSSRATTTFTR